MDLIAGWISRRMSVLDISSAAKVAFHLYISKNAEVQKVTGVTVSTERLAVPGAHVPGISSAKHCRLRSMEGGSVASSPWDVQAWDGRITIFPLKTTKRLESLQGCFLLHTISSKKKTGANPWINKYIFPADAASPSSFASRKAITGFMLRGRLAQPKAITTRRSWHSTALRRLCGKALSNYSERMRHMYQYYLLSCAGAFRARDIQLWQIVLSPEGVEGGYCCQR